MTYLPFITFSALALGASAFMPSAPSLDGLTLPTGSSPFTTAGFGILLLAAFLALWRALERRTDAQLKAYEGAAAAQVTAYKERQEQDRRQSDELLRALLAAATVGEEQRTAWRSVNEQLVDLSGRLSDIRTDQHAGTESLRDQTQAEHAAISVTLEKHTALVALIHGILMGRDPNATVASQKHLMTPPSRPGENQR